MSDRTAPPPKTRAAEVAEHLAECEAVFALLHQRPRDDAQIQHRAKACIERARQLGLLPYQRHPGTPATQH